MTHAYYQHWYTPKLHVWTGNVDVVEKIHNLSQLVLIYLMWLWYPKLKLYSVALVPIFHGKGFSKTKRKKEKTRNPLFDKSEARCLKCKLVNVAFSYV